MKERKGGRGIGKEEMIEEKKRREIRKITKERTCWKDKEGNRKEQEKRRGRID
jgi:hypothetical protein